MYDHQLETFVRVADAGSFNKAADDAFVTPTAVIKQINLLESELDLKLFVRCEQSRNALAVIGKWSCVHPMLKVLPVQWDHAIPFGILHPPEPSPMLARFLDAVRAVVRANG